MMLVELLRQRWWTVWWAAVILVIGVVLGVSAQHTIVDVNGTRLGGIAIPVVALAPVAMFLAMIYATSSGLSLNREAQTLALSWTKPLSRPAVALRLIATDVVMLVTAYVFAWLIVLGVVAAANGTLIGSPQVPAIIGLSLGVTLMWYALIQAITAALPANTGIVVGLLWPGALVLSGLNGSINPTVDTVIRVLNAFNPLAYLNSASHSSVTTQATGYWQLAPGEAAAIVWVLSVVFLVVAVALWQRREA
jgi:ABC-type transport system involved in multi-copper enzyme maturation permease subunit